MSFYLLVLNKFLKYTIYLQKVFSEVQLQLFKCNYINPLIDWLTPTNPLKRLESMETLISTLRRCARKEVVFLPRETWWSQDKVVLAPHQLVVWRRLNDTASSVTWKTPKTGVLCATLGSRMTLYQTVASPKTTGYEGWMGLIVVGAFVISWWRFEWENAWNQKDYDFICYISNVNECNWNMKLEYFLSWLKKQMKL